MGAFLFAFVMSDLEKLHTLCAKTYKQQAVWFLNCFWQDFAEKEAEIVWQYVDTNSTLDLENHEEGSGLDEMKAHVFLEKFDEALTVRAMREKLRSTGAIGETERPKVVPLTHYLLYKYNVDWHKLVDETRQGSNKEEMEKAEKMLQEVTALFKESEAKASVARQKHNEAQSAENAAKASEAAAIQRESEAKAAAEQAKKTEIQANNDAAAAKATEAEAKAAQQELEVALQELHAQEKAYNDKKAELQKKSEEGGVVSRNKAANELAQLLAEDPLPLRRAKITQEAAVKKAERATNIAAAAREAATKARQESEAAAASATTARQQAEADATAATAAAKAAAAAKEEADAALESARVQL